MKYVSVINGRLMKVHATDEVIDVIAEKYRLKRAEDDDLSRSEKMHDHDGTLLIATPETPYFRKCNGISRVASLIGNELRNY